MPATAFDWNQIQDVAIRFGPFNTKGNAHKHEALNHAFAHCLEYMDSLFITDDDAEGPKTLAPDPVSMLREIIVNAIMDIIPSREQTAVNKRHISRLLADATFWYVAPNQLTKRLRNKHSMDKAGELAIKNGQDTIFIEIRATHWGFTPDWDAIHFGEIYDTNIYSFPDATQNRYGKSNTRDATMVADKTADASRARFANLQQQKYVTPKANLLHATYTSTSSIVNASVPSPYKAILSDTTKIVDSNAAATPVAALSATQAPFRWTFTPQHDIATFRRLPKSAPSPSPPSGTLGEATDLPNAIPAYIRSLRTPCCNLICPKPKYQPVLRLSKRHRDALIVKLYHLYANILSMNWFYDFFD
eukprot:jgi/Psemu1/39502/gm1.39502_g